MARPRAPLLLTCEHGGHRVPQRYAALFRGREALLASHRGWDPGALVVARALARALCAPLIAATTTRLLVDLNRSPHNPAVLSPWTRRLSGEERRELLRRHHAPHWRRVRREIAGLAPRRGALLHLAVHSFTARWRGGRRELDLGILYDARRCAERRLAERWQAELGRAHPELRVRRNSPYRGSTDGLTTALRRELDASRYLGLELELSQALFANSATPRRLAGILATTLSRARAAGGG